MTPISWLKITRDRRTDIFTDCSTKKDISAQPISSAFIAPLKASLRASSDSCIHFSETILKLIAEYTALEGRLVLNSGHCYALELSSKLGIQVFTISPESIQKCETEHLKNGLPCCQDGGHPGTWSDAAPHPLPSFPGYIPLSFLMNRDGTYKKHDDLLYLLCRWKRFGVSVVLRCTYVKQYPISGETPASSFEGCIEETIANTKKIQGIEDRFTRWYEKIKAAAAKAIAGTYQKLALKIPKSPK